MSIKVIKKNGTWEEFKGKKIIQAVEKSANRVNMIIEQDEAERLIRNIRYDLGAFGQEYVSVDTLHTLVEKNLLQINEAIGKSYGSYRDYKKRFNKTFDNILTESKSIVYNGNKDNANKDSQLISTKKELISGSLSKEIYLEYELPKDIANAHKDGDLYIHDTSDRIFGSINCCLFDMATVLRSGFILNGVQYTEPTSAESALRVLSDIILQASSQQYGGFTVPEIDNVLAPYVESALRHSISYYRKELPVVVTDEHIERLAYKYVERALEQGFQATETRLNTINNSNGQTAFITISFGLNTTEAGRLVSKVLIENRKNGIGANHLTPVFPKLVFLHRNGINGQEGDTNYDIYCEAIKCSLVRVYPDYLSLNAGYLGEIFDKYGLAISPMGCRAFLSPWFERGGMYPADENDVPVFTGRANCGAVTLNTVRYAIEADGDKEQYKAILYKNFVRALDVHLLTFENLKKSKASSNPLFFCEGGCHIKLQPEESIERAIRTFTWSFGYIGLNEASLLMIGKEIHEDNSFAVEVLEYLDMLVEKAKKKHGLLFAIYGTPAESLCYTLRNKDFKKYGSIKGVTDKDYYMNSFHVDVKATVNAKQKQDAELPMFNLSKGGRITYNEFPSAKNFKGVKQMIDYAMTNGRYFGANLELDKCNGCGADGEFEGGICPHCGSTDVTMINRVCGYLGYKQINGDTRYNDGKVEEVNNRQDHFGLRVNMEDLSYEL